MLPAGQAGTVELTTLPDNHRTYALYEELGFHLYADVSNLAGDGRIVIERAMFLQTIPGVVTIWQPESRSRW